MDRLYNYRLGYAALQVIEQHLTKYSFFVSDRYSIADIAIYSYVHAADQGGYDLTKFPAIQTWCNRVRSQPNYISIATSIAGL